MSIPPDYDPLAPESHDYGPPAPVPRDYEPRASVPQDYEPLASVPPDYRPLASDDAPTLPPPVPAAARPRERPREPAANRLDVPQPAPRVIAPSWVPSRAENSGASGGRAPAGTSDRPFTSDFAAVLMGAGLDPADVTPELARTFGQILRVVVSGVMDVMRSRQQIKDEFRMRMTQFKPAENNPLKFSANVDDALHNLLVKRNAAYLGPVEAFEDAFADLRNHQIAMLAGMRVAFESMLAEFDPDSLQQEFDRQLGKGLMPAKLRYWDLYREKRDEMIKDPEASFRRLFGEEFARAYEEQLKQLKAEDGSAERASPRLPRPPDT
jgi:type VI secretion system FHA domain protein